MTMSYKYIYDDDSVVYEETTGVVKSIQAYLSGTNSNNDLSHGIAILADQEGGQLMFDTLTNEQADQWMNDYLALTPGLKLQYESDIANAIKDQAAALAATPPKVASGRPSALS